MTALPPTAAGESERLAALMRHDLLDTPAEPAFDEIVSLIASLCGVPIALVSLVDGDRQWFKAKVGVTLTETARSESFCAHAIAAPDRLLVVPDARMDPRFAASELVIGAPFIRFYAAAPLVDSAGFALGTLCVIDTVPRFLTGQQEDALRVGAHAVMTLIEQRTMIRQLQAVTRAQIEVENALREEIAQRRRVEEQLSFSSTHDGLTELPNRSAFVSRIEAGVAALHSCHRRFAVCFIDLDRFKDVNDTLGHAVGDALLVEVGRRLREAIRPADIVARLGGDEFTVYVDGVATEAAARAIVDRIEHVLASELRIGGTEIRVTASIGILLVDDDYHSIEDILRDADIAMYAAKDAGRNRATIFTPALRDRLARSNAQQRVLREALEHRRFRLAYQPIFALNGPRERPIAFESLLRLPRADGEWESAGAFIHIAEQTGLIVELGEWVLREACAQARRWRDAGLAPFITTVNVSAKQLAEADFARTVKATVARAGVDPALIGLEVTESILIADVDASRAILSELRTFGMQIYLDDFGTGYSSLSYLRRFPVDRIKIDRSFVSGAGDALADPQIVNAIVSLAHELRLSVVAEGVETEQQRSALAALGCDWAQGFLFSPALPEDAALRLLGRSHASSVGATAAALRVGAMMRPRPGADAAGKPTG